MVLVQVQVRVRVLVQVRVRVRVLVQVRVLVLVRVVIPGGVRDETTVHGGVYTRRGVNGVGDRLGTIEWHKRWKCWQFNPNPSTGFTEDCLRDLADHLFRTKKL